MTRAAVRDTMAAVKPKRIQRALISVYDKTEVVAFARTLSHEFGIEIISTGGTAAILRENGLPVTLVEHVTGFPEMMDGRVKTLHPKIHAAILADRDNPDHMRQLAAQGIDPIDMVVVNLYPFERTTADSDCTFEQAIEMIDIGGPCLLRAAAKNHRHVVPVPHRQSYTHVCKELREHGDVSDGLRTALAAGVFDLTATYDRVVKDFLAKQRTDVGATPGEPAGTSGTADNAPAGENGLIDLPDLKPTDVRATRYGENPHQRGYVGMIEDGAKEADLVRALRCQADTALSFNNYADGHAALELCKELSNANGPTEPRSTRVCVFVKHMNACGVGVADEPVEAYRRAYLGDPNAAMGGILACNSDVTEAFAQAVMATYDRFGKAAGAGGFFVEVWIAPAFADDAVEIVRSAKKWGSRVRLLAVGDMSVRAKRQALEYRSITGGVLVQSRDLAGLDEDEWRVVTKRAPTDREWDDLRLAWLVCKHTKSNAVTLCRDGMLLGNGAGQMSRVMSCRIATWLAQENGHAERLSGSAAASDAFFPFPDGPKLLIEAGVTAVIQPGGSKRDDDTIAACDEHDVAMVLSGTRHLKH